MAQRTKRAYFRENTSVTQADGTVIPGDRFLDQDVPTEETFKRLLEAYTNVLEQEDKAKIDEQGLVRIVSGNNAKQGNTPDTDYTYVAQIKNLPTLDNVRQTIDTLSDEFLIDLGVSGTDNNQWRLQLSQRFLDWLTLKFEKLQDQIDNIDTGTNYDQAITELNGKTQTNADAISDNQDSITNLQSQIDDVDTDLQSTQNQVNQNTADIAAINVTDGRFLGEVCWRASTTAPNASWLQADGQAVSRATYADLFTLIGTTFGAGDGSTTFNLPNLTGKSVRGEGVGFALGANAGSDTVTIGVDDLPAHSHGVTNVSVSTDIDTSNTAGSDSSTLARGNGTNDGTITFNADVTGSTDDNNSLATPLNVTNPYLVLVPFIKTTN